MKDRPIKNVAASVRARLLNHAKEVGRPANDIFLHYGMERFLYRLSRSDFRDRLILKGALMLVAWRAPSVRPTADIDLLGRMPNDPDLIEQTVRTICKQAVEDDGVNFLDSTIQREPIAEEAEYEGVRVRFEGRLDTIRLRMQIDFGFGDLIASPPDEVEFPVLLDLPAPHILAYPRETLIAEKLHVMLVRQQLNSRMKDYYDIWLLSRSFSFDGDRLSRAIAKTCEARGTPVPAEVLGLQQEFAEDAGKTAQWRAFRRRSKLVDAPEVFSEVVGAVRDFLERPVQSVATGNALDGKWPPAGPWQRSAVR